jgi:hypothetical protein
VGREPVKPSQLEIELRTGRRIAIRQVKAADQQAIDSRLDVAAVGIVRIAGQPAPGFDGIGSARQDRDAVPAFLPMPNRAVAGVADRAFWELVLRRLQFLQADDVGRSLIEPAQKYGEPAVDPIDIEGRDLHGASIYAKLIGLSSPRRPLAYGVKGCSPRTSPRRRRPCRAAVPWRYKPARHRLARRNLVFGNAAIYWHAGRSEYCLGGQP